MTEVERLRDRVEELERLLGMRETFPRQWGLTGRQSEVFGLLLKRPVLSREQFYLAAYGGQSDRVGNVIEVMVCKMRLKLAPHMIEIKTEWGLGYFLPPESKRRALALIELDRSEYDGRKDFAGSLDVGYAAIRARQAAGGPGWEPKA